MSSKLALHVTKGNAEVVKAIDGLENAKFIKIMTLDKPILDALRRLRERCPTVMIGYRRWWEDSRMDDLSENNWKNMINDMFTDVCQAGALDLVELIFTPYNERFMLVELGLEKYVAELPKMAMYARKLWRSMSKNILVAGGNFPATTPRLNEWDIVARCFDALDFIVVHEYAQPTMMDFPEVLYAHEEVIKRHPNMPPIIIGECGIDHALYTTPPDYRGWKASMQAEDFAEELDGYHLHISTNPKVFASCVFQVGDERWFTYETLHPAILKVFNASYESDKEHVEREKPHEVQTWYKDQVSRPETEWTDEQLGGPRAWLPNELSHTFADWRFTEGNHWPPHTDVERKEFWAHCERLNIPVKEYQNKTSMWRVRGNERQPMLNALAHLMDVDQLILEAILAREGAGQSFGPGGYPLMRVEAHIVLRDAHDKAAINKVLRVNGPHSWQGHQYCELGIWHDYHNDQELEQKVLAKCAIVDSEAAFSGTSFGMFQIMGQHHSRLGFGSAEEMAKELRYLEMQHYTFAMFCATGGCLQALREGRIEDFVREFNGDGMVADYSQFIREYVAERS